uniref:arylamine N-acetyltransferase n=1 Tax=Branchiostoma floridae TaxID=7739 RepID=C4A0R7_BRAFL|eukprot:XP_002585602.1 hypothetical protein BRAFLDRAFT_111745 [Branchiostoma floridae]
MDVRRYLSRIRYHGDTRPNLENLRAVHLAHILAVPFENLRIQREGDMWFLQRLKYSHQTKLTSDCRKATPGGTDRDVKLETGKQWVLKFKFTLQERELQELSNICKWTEKCHHVYSVRPLCVLPLADGLMTYMGRNLITTRYEDTRVSMATTALESDDDILNVLWDTFGIKLDKHLVVKD